MAVAGPPVMPMTVTGRSRWSSSVAELDRWCCVPSTSRHRRRAVHTRGSRRPRWQVAPVRPTTGLMGLACRSASDAELAVDVPFPRLDAPFWSRAHEPSKPVADGGAPVRALTGLACSHSWSSRSRATLEVAPRLHGAGRDQPHELRRCVGDGGRAGKAADSHGKLELVSGDPCELTPAACPQHLTVPAESNAQLCEAPVERGWRQ